MPHDTMPLDLAIDNKDEKLSGIHQAKGRSGMLAAFKVAKREVSIKLRRASTGAMLLAMIAAGIALGSPRKAEAQTSYTAMDLGVGDASPVGVNNSGQVLGYLTPSYTTFVYSAGTVTYLNQMGVSAITGGGINDNGQVVGSCTPDACLYSGGSYIDLGTLSQMNPGSGGLAVNISGQAVGSSLTSNGDSAAVLFSGGSVTNLGTLGGDCATPNQARGINDNEDIVGTSGTSIGYCRAFLYTGGGMINLGTLPGGLNSNGVGINNNGQIIGLSNTASGFTHGFVYANGTMTDLGTLPGGANSWTNGINNNGQVVGDSYTATQIHGFIYNQGQMTDLNNVVVNLPQGVFINSANAINDIGQIVVQGSDYHAYLLTPMLQVASKTLGNPNDVPGGCSCGDPINAATGNLFEEAADYKTAGQNPLGFTRYYNSMEVVSNPATFATTLGTNWRSNFDRYLNIVSGSSVKAERADGQVVTFTLNGSTWTPDSDVDLKLTNVGSTWTLIDHNDNVESYTASGTKGTLNSITARNGYTQTLHYTGTQLTSVSDSYGRSLGFTYSGGLLQTLTTPDSETFTYGFTAVGSGKALTSVAYSTSPVTNITYQYGNSAFPFVLTGIVDEKSQQYATWTYDNTTGRALTSQHGTGTSTDNLTTVTANSNGTVTVTNAFGVEDTYTFSTLQGVPKVTQIARAATATTAAATRTFSYDSNGYLNSETDWNGNQTTYLNNTQGNPTTINYAVGSPQAYSVTIQYDPTFTHLPHIVTMPGVTSTYVRDVKGNPLSRTDQDTTTNNIPYSTNGQTRETQWTWSATGEELSIQLPRTDLVVKTQFGYDGTGALTSIKDALNHTTQITVHTGGGLPQTIIDPNNVMTTLVYDKRLNLNTSTLATTAGNLVTTWTYDAANELQSLQLPDNSKLTYGYDTAHRLTSITDLPGNNTTYTLDALGGTTLTNVKNTVGTVMLTHSAVFDALDRRTSDIGGMGQTTVYSYDNMGNTSTITPPSPSGAITQTFDALNRLATRTDPSPGGTTTLTYDSFNRALSVKDANLNTTSYVYNGFGDRTQTASPDSGTTVFHFDPDRNVTQRVQPGNLTANYTYDALDRTLTVRYMLDLTLNVTNTYDQATGHGFGIGRLTSATDQAGTLSLTYDERGNITQETRTPAGLAALNTSTSFDAAGNVSSITYPSGNLVSYTRDSMGKITSVTSKPSGAGSPTNIVTSVTYDPLPEFALQGAPPVASLTFGNGVTGTYNYDLDYRPTTRVDMGTTAVQNLSYGYFANNSVQTITDRVKSANTQNMTYDALDRLSTAFSGIGGYGAYHFTWDPVDNIKTQVINGTTTTYNLNTGTNQLASIVTGSTTETVTTSASGNITAFKIGATTVETLAYNRANELASASTASQSASYAFDEFGKRLKEVGTATGTSTFQYDRSGNVLTDTDGAGNSRVDYIYLNNTPVGTYQPSNSNFYYIGTDRLGTPAVATDSAKVVQWSASYQPFGYTTTGASGIVQNLRLPGQEWDLESTYNHNGFRDYAATLTRYVQSDPIGLAGGMNTYQYAKSNPFKFVDPTGTNVLTDWLMQKGLTTWFSHNTQTALGTSHFNADTITNFVFDVLGKSNGICSAVAAVVTPTPITNGDEQQWLFQNGATGYQRLQSISNTNTINTFLGGTSSTPVGYNGSSFTSFGLNKGPVPQ